MSKWKLAQTVPEEWFGMCVGEQGLLSAREGLSSGVAVSCGGIWWLPSVPVGILLGRKYHCEVLGQSRGMCTARLGSGLLQTSVFFFLIAP